MSETKTAVRFYFAWEAEKEERWLEEMARAGWHLTSGGIVFRFRRGEAAEVRYRLDYRNEHGEALREYVGLCRDAGWEHVARFGGWLYFRTADAAAPELYTDAASLAERYKRLIALLAVLLVVNVSGAARFVDHPGRFDALRDAIYLVQTGVVLLLVYAIVMLGLRWRRLRMER